MNAGEPMRPIGEDDVQAEVVAALRTDRSLRDAWLSALAAKEYSESEGGEFVTARRSVTTRSGETDVQAEWRHASGNRLHVLVELKLAAAFQPKQGERYRARAETGSARALRVKTVLLAPKAYLACANPEARHFDHRMALEEFAELVPGISALGLTREVLKRLALLQPLGARGLFQSLYLAVANELTRRESQLRILNHPTDWMSLKFQNCPAGVNLNFRIKAAIPEIRVLASYKGDRSRLTDRSDVAKAVVSGGELFLRLRPLSVTDAARSGGHPTPKDVTKIVDSFETLIALWARLQ